MNEVEYWIWLQQALGPCSARVSLLLATFEGAESVYSAQRADFLAVPGLTGRETDRLCNKSFDEVEKVTEACLRYGYRIITLGDDDFPKRLSNIYAPPCVLYVKGELYPVDDAVLIAVVGTRQLTEYGSEVATQLAMGLASHGAVVVSGLAIGVDATAHKGALKGGGKTIAVIGCGLDIDYPATNRELRRLIASNGAVVSEYPPGTPPMSFNFPARNRIIAGLSLGTVVVEAGAKSGSLITAGLAAEMGRDVFAVPGSIFSPFSDGTNRLLRDGAKPVMNVTDILEEYIELYPQTINVSDLEKSAALKNPDGRFHVPDEGGEKSEQLVIKEVRSTGINAKKAPQNLTKAQAAVYGILGDTPVHVDQISLRANLEPRIVLGALTTLEIQGFVRSLPGRCFTVV